MILLLGGYFVLVTTGLALLFLPGARLIALSGWRKGAQRLTRWATQLQQAGLQRMALAGGSGLQLWSRTLNGLSGHIRMVLATACILVLAPVAAVLWRHGYQIETFDHTDMRVADERIAALLTGERLVPPAPLPPEVFTTQEVELARPTVRFASRDWALLDAEFAQRLLIVFRIMREQHGYEMLLLEGYRSPQRQEQLAALGGHVTRAGAFRSYHQYGLAADSAFMRDGKVVISERDPWAMRGYELYGAAAASVGLTWGGGWRQIKDYGHVELRRANVLGRTDTEARPGMGYQY